MCRGASVVVVLARVVLASVFLNVRLFSWCFLSRFCSVTHVAAVDVVSFFSCFEIVLAAFLIPFFLDSPLSFLRTHTPTRSESGGTENMWYSFDVGLVHFIQISTETDFPDGMRVCVGLGVFSVG